MTSAEPRQMAALAAEMTRNGSQLRADLTEFPSGGAVLDLRRPDGRMFVMAYSPSRGFGVDEADEDAGLSSTYRFTSADFTSAAARLRELVEQAPAVSSPKLALLVLYCSDLPAAREFYSSLGVSLRPERHGTGPEHFSAVLGETVLELYPCSDRHAAGGGRLGLAVADLASVLDRVRHSSPAVRIVSEPQPSPWGLRAVVEGPDAVCIELTELAG